VIITINHVESLCTFKTITKVASIRINVLPKM